MAAIAAIDWPHAVTWRVFACCCNDWPFLDLAAPDCTVVALTADNLLPRDASANDEACGPGVA